MYHKTFILQIQCNIIATMIYLQYSYMYAMLCNDIYTQWLFFAFQVHCTCMKLQCIHVHVHVHVYQLIINTHILTSPGTNSSDWLLS